MSPKTDPTRRTGSPGKQQWPPPQTAYDSLCTFAEANYTALSGRHHVGTIFIAGGNGVDYEVGDALVLRRNRIAEFRGVTAGRAQDRYEGLPRLATTSSTATEMISLLDADAGGSNGYGFGFHNLGFSADITVSTLLTAVIRAHDCNFVDVTGCSTEITGGNMPGYFIESDGDLDNSWWTVENNRIEDMGLVWCIGTQFNNNRWWVAHNSVFGTITGSGIAGITAIIRMKRTYDWTVAHNNLEAANVGIYASSGGNHNFINNHGECSSFDEPFYLFDSAIDAIIIGGRQSIHSIGTSQSGIFARADGSSQGIQIWNPQLVQLTAAATAFKDRVDDNTTNNGAMQVWSRDGFQLSSQGLVVPWLGANPAVTQQNPDGILWYDEVNGRFVTRLATVTHPVLLRDTEVARGSSTILDTTSTLVVAHGMPATPTSVVVTPAGNELIWVTSIGATNFTLNRAGTSGARIVTWMAQR